MWIIKETPPAQYHLGEGRTTTRSLVCRYVRREIRRLSDRDRELYLDALHQISSLRAEAGRAKFGERFFNLAHFATLHLTLAGTREGDQLHDGLGFLTGMIALSASFERALQAVNPALALPYWDFTYEGNLVRDAGTLQAAWNTPLWSDGSALHHDGSLAWFGEARKSHHAVINGRFAYQTITRDPSYEVHSAYGCLRAPGMKLRPSSLSSLGASTGSARAPPRSGARPGAKTAVIAPASKPLRGWRKSSSA